MESTLVTTIVLLVIVAVLAWLAYTYVKQPFGWILAGVIILLGVIKLLA